MVCFLAYNITPQHRLTGIYLQIWRHLLFWELQDHWPQLAFTMDVYKNIHKQDTKKWPDVLHGLEVPMVRTALQRYVIEDGMVHTFGSQRPQQRIDTIFTISFELEGRKKTTRVTSYDRKPNDSDDKEKDDDEKRRRS